MGHGLRGLGVKGSQVQILSARPKQIRSSGAVSTDPTGLRKRSLIAFDGPSDGIGSHPPMTHARGCRVAHGCAQRGVRRCAMTARTRTDELTGHTAHWDAGRTSLLGDVALPRLPGVRLAPRAWGLDPFDALSIARW